MANNISANDSMYLSRQASDSVDYSRLNLPSKYIVKIQYFVVNNLHWLHAGLDCCVGLVEIKSSFKYIVKIQYFVVNNLHWLHAGLDCCVGFCAGSGPGGAKP